MNKRSDIFFLLISGLLFRLFLANIFIGKIALSYGMDPFLALGEVGEFLTLLASVVFFVIVILHQEKGQKD